MIIKKYTGKTEAEATENAKKELGNAVVIMNVKEVKPKGFLACLRGKQVEITVALEEEHEKYSALRKESAPVRKVENSTKEKTVSEESKSIEEKLENLQNLLVNRLKAEEVTEVQSTVALKDKETSVEKEQTEDYAVTDEKEDEYLRFLKLLYNMMVDNEVDERYANQMIEGLDKAYKPGQTYDQLLANIYQRLILKFGKSTGITPAAQGPKLVLFIGPTGVGKTTTIAKLASKFSLEQKKKVALLTTDTYRIAAAEQLRTYANILQVPFRVIYTEEEMVATVKDFYQCDYIFVDTAGHSHQNKAQKESMAELVKCVDGIAQKELFLVLSATTKYKDLLSIADSYKEMGNYKLIFTKLDETTALGNLLNLKLYTGASLSYVTYGQNVPDDIEKFNPQKTVKQLLGGRS